MGFHGRPLRHLLIFGCFLICPVVGRAEQITSWQVSFIHPLQVYSDDYSVDCFRLDIIYGVNEDVKGVDIGMINETKHNVHGFEWGLVNQVKDDFGGWQLGLVNEVHHDFKGFQLGLLANRTKGSCQGFQASVFFNDAEEDLRGLQLGIVNNTGSLYGVQIGLLNFNDDERYLGFFPFIRAAF
jgi:hypothetical protein